MVLPGPFQKGHAACPRHFLIGEDDVDRVCGEQAPGGVRGRRREHGKFVGEQPRQGRQHGCPAEADTAESARTIGGSGSRTTPHVTQTAVWPRSSGWWRQSARTICVSRPSRGVKLPVMVSYPPC